MKFSELNLVKPLLDSLTEMGFEEPTPIQQKAVPIALTGSDMIGQAQTGTGKTAAFGLPMLNKLDNRQQAIQGLVVAPTRELAIQVQEELYRLGKFQKAKVYVVYGGAPIQKQIDRLKRNQPQIVVGTPGRILDLLRRKALALSHLQTLVLDEADEMLNMGFMDDVKEIAKATPSSRQTLLFSATMPPEIKSLAEQFLKEPEHVKVKAKEMTADLIEQFFVKCRDDEKFDIFTRLLDVQMPTQAIVFCRTKKRVDEVARGLSIRGYNAELIHGDITQQKRTSVINAFRQGQVEILVATDVAARGLDISGVTHVYNYDISQDPESYVHRIGRTGRAGNEGMSVTFVTSNEMAYLRVIEDLTRKQMTPLKPPTLKEAQQGQVQQVIDQVNDILESDQGANHYNSAKLLLQHYDETELVAALLSRIITDSTNVEVKISPQKPLPYLRERRSDNRRGEHGGNRGRKRSNGGDRKHYKGDGKKFYGNKKESKRAEKRDRDAAHKKDNRKQSKQYKIQKREA